MSSFHEKSISIKTIRALVKYLSTCILLILLCLLGIQGITLFTQINDKKIPLPHYLVKKIQKSLNIDTLNIKHENASIHLNGEIEVNNLSISASKTNYAIAKCQYASIKINILSLLFGYINIDSLLINDATLYCPPTHSPTGLNEPFIDNLYTQFNLKGRICYLTQLFFNFNNLEVYASGEFKSKKLPKNSEFSLSHYFNFLSKVIEKQITTTAFDSPKLNIHITHPPHSPLTLNIRGEANKLLGLKEISSEKIEAQVQLYHKHKRLHSKTSLKLKIHELNYKNEIKASLAILQGTLPKTLSKSLKLNTIRISLSNPISPHLEAKGFFASCSSLDFENHIKASFGLALNDQEWIKGTIQTNNLNENKIVKATGNFDVNTLKYFHPSLFSHPENLPVFENPPNWTFNAELNKELKLKKALFSLTSGPNTYKGIQSDTLYLYAKTTPKKLNIETAYITGSNTYIEGSFSHNFKTQDYRFLLEGHIAPTKITALMKPWWSNFWNDYDFTPQQPPITDIDIQSNWKNPGNYSIFAHIKSHDFNYRNTKINRCTVNLKASSDFLEIDELHANLKQGSITGKLFFDYPKQGNTTALTSFEGSSTCPLQDLNNLINNKKLTPIINKLICQAPPQLYIKGFNLKEVPEKAQYFIDFQSKNPLILKKIPLDYLTFQAHYTPQYTTLENIKFGFAGGEGKCEASLTEKANQPSELSLTTSLNNAHLGHSLMYLKSISNTPTSNSQKKQLLEQQGNIDLNLQATGIPNNLSSFVGNGDISIKEANLGKIHLFGILSRVLNLTPFALGSFQLTEANSNFQVQKDRIHFPNLNIYGPTASIMAEGNFFIETRELDFLLQVSPKPKTYLPFISQAFTLLSPITQSFEVQLNGTVENPNWDIKLTPLGFFKTKSTKKTEPHLSYQ